MSTKDQCWCLLDTHSEEGLSPKALRKIKVNKARAAYQQGITRKHKGTKKKKNQNKQLIIQHGPWIAAKRNFPSIKWIHLYSFCIFCYHVIIIVPFPDSCFSVSLVCSSDVTFHLLLSIQYLLYKGILLCVSWRLPVIRSLEWAWLQVGQFISCLVAASLTNLCPFVEYIRVDCARIDICIN